VIKVGNIAYLDELLAANRLVDELKVLRHRNAAAWIDSKDSGDDDQIGSDDDGDGIPRIKLKVKPLQSGIIKEKINAKEPDGSRATEVTPAPEITPEAISPLIPVSGVELESEDTATIPINYYFRKSRRKGDGPRLRAARAKAEAIRNGKKWYCTGDPCIYGHYSDRLVSNGKCRECNRLD
jgi:hypothetical protein